MTALRLESTTERSRSVPATTKAPGLGEFSVIVGGVESMVNVNELFRKLPATSVALIVTARAPSARPVVLMSHGDASELKAPPVLARTVTVFASNTVKSRVVPARIDAPLAGLLRVTVGRVLSTLNE